MEIRKKKKTTEIDEPIPIEEPVNTVEETMVEPTPMEEDEKMAIEWNQEQSVDEFIREINASLRFGDRIQVITTNGTSTGIFLELDDRYIIWVIDEGRLTFTDIAGATIIKLS